MNGFARKPEEETQGRIIIRYYHHPDDLVHIQRVFVDATMSGKGSPVQKGMAHFSAARLLYPAMGSITLLQVLSSTPALRRALPESWHSLRVLRWSQILIGSASLLGSAYMWYRRNQVERFFNLFLQDGLAEELGDIVGSFKLHIGEGGVCVPTGPSSFWVAEKDGEVVGFIGLNKDLHPDPTVGAARRLAVAPAHQGKGIAQKLMATLTSHALAHGLHALELTTSNYNRSALRLYQKLGWEMTGRIDYHGFQIAVLRQDLTADR